MTKVKMLTDFQELPRDAVATLPDGMAAELIKGGRAIDFADVKQRVFEDAPEQKGWLSALKNTAIRVADGVKVKTK